MTEEKEHVRELALEVAEIARSPEMKAVIKRWRDVNAMRKPDRAPVWCKPVGAWAEILPEDRLKCSSPWLRNIERQLRQKLIKHDIGDDEPFHEWFEVPARFDVEPENVWGVEVGRHSPDSSTGAWGYDPPLKSEDDFGKLKRPRFTYNARSTDIEAEKAADLLGDILPVRITCGAPLGGTLAEAADLRGLAEMMMDMADAPALMHRLMAHLRDSVLASIDAAEASGQLTPNNFGPMIESDPVGSERAAGKYSLGNQWTMVNSQEFDQVSPAMWEEFCLAYQKPILERYGLSAYGCCENLTHKIGGVLSIPNLRIFVCSAWSNLDAVVEKVGGSKVIMWRQKASDVVFPDDDETVRHALLAGMKKLQGHHVQIVLRELQTLSGHPDRLHAWTRHAVEAAEKYA